VPSRLLYNCCKDWPERVNLEWLEQNPGKLFHTPTMTQDRTEMLAGKKCQSCDWGCYKYEAKGLISARARSAHGQITDVHHPLKTLKIILSTDCNLTCAYCSAEWSTSWYQDIKKHGEYGIDGYKNKKDNWSLLWNKMKQKDRSTDSRFFQLLINDIKLTPSIEQIYLLGGEPLLNNSLMELLETIKDKKITITSGLGVNKDRLIKIIDKLKIYNIQFDISAETTGQLFEFIRHGEKWKDFLSKISLIKEAGFEIQFGSVITNLTSFGLLEFYKMFEGEHKISYNPVSDRPFLQFNVLDDISKKHLLDSIQHRLNNPFFKHLHDSISQPHTDKQKQDLKKFLVEFSRRRNLSLAIFPKHFLDWLEII
jgi:organic radical activating enzyme